MSTDFLTIDTDQELRSIMQKLNTLPDQIASPSILKNAINSAARKARTQIKKDALKRYAITDKTILTKTAEGGPQVLTASVASMTATVKSKGPMTDVMDFLTSPNSETGAAAAQVLNSGGLKMLEKGSQKAFVTQFKSGHIAIVQRKTDEKLPVKKITSPAVPHMLGNEEVRGQAETMAYSYLQTEIEKRIAKINLK